MQEPIEPAEKKPKGWRLGVASVLIVLSLSSVLFGPLVAGMDLSTEVKTAISGLLVLGLPQLLMIIAVTIVGKSGFNYIKAGLADSSNSSGLLRPSAKAATALAYCCSSFPSCWDC